MLAHRFTRNTLSRRLAWGELAHTSTCRLHTALDSVLWRTRVGRYCICGVVLAPKRPACFTNTSRLPSSLVGMIEYSITKLRYHAGGCCWSRCAGLGTSAAIPAGCHLILPLPGVFGLHLVWCAPVFCLANRIRWGPFVVWKAGSKCVDQTGNATILTFRSRHRSVWHDKLPQCLLHQLCNTFIGGMISCDGMSAASPATKCRCCRSCGQEVLL